MSSLDEAESLLSGAHNNIQEDTVTGCGTAACNPQRAPHRLLVLTLICFLSFGLYFGYDTPSALQSEVKYAMDVDTSSFMLLYSLFSWPNVILCFFGGFLLDRVFGIRLGAIVFSTFVVFGQCITATGATINSYSMMLVGRFVFGIGGESLTVAQNTYAATWFKDRGLNLVFGLLRSVSRCGSTINMNVMKPIYDLTNGNVAPHYKLAVAFWVGGGVCVFSLLCSVCLGYLDKRAARILKRNSGETSEVIHIKNIKEFPLTLWLLFLICVSYYVAVIPFIGLAVLVYFICAGSSPLFGFLVDTFGRSILWVMMGIIGTLASHVMLAFTFYSPFIAMSVMGCSFSILVCSLWPIVAFIVPQHQLGTAYGCMQSIFNLGLAVVSQISGSIVDAYGYFILEVFFITCLCVAFFSGVILYLVDASKGGFLNLSTKQRLKFNTNDLG